MINKQDIRKIVQHIQKRQQGIPDRKLMHPRREWLRILSCLAIVTIAGLGYAYFTYEKVTSISEEIEDPVVTVPRYRVEQVQAANELFGARRQQLDALLARPILESAEESLQSNDGETDVEVENTDGVASVEASGAEVVAATATEAQDLDTSVAAETSATETAPAEVADGDNAAAVEVVERNPAVEEETETDAAPAAIPVLE